MKYIYSVLLLIISYVSYSQNEVDALRYSFLRHGGTARYTGMSGAFGALGADFSSLSTNPAGVATFRKYLQVTLSPEVVSTGVTAKYRENEIEKYNLSFGVSNLGVIISIKNDYEGYSKWRNVCFGLGYNKLLNLSENASIQGYSEESSMLDQFAMNSNGYTPDELFDNYKEIEWLAWAAELTDVIKGSTDNTYEHQYLSKTYLQQHKTYKNRGGVGEYLFSIGGNYDNKLQIGASLGIQSVRYENETTYTESSDSTDLSSYTFTEELNTSGAGFNLKLGLIYIPFRFLRLAAAIHTPTYYTFTDIYSYSMQSKWRTPDADGNDQYKYSTKDFNENGTSENEFSYELFAPYRFITSAAIVVSRFAILSADYEYVDYSMAKLKSLDDNFSKQNANIKDLYHATRNIRLGTEIRLTPIYLRGGVSHYGSPYSENYDDKGCVRSYSFGIGFKSKSFYADFAYNHSEYSKDYKMFDYIKFLDNGKTELATEMAELKFNQNTIGVTVGFRF